MTIPPPAISLPENASGRSTSYRTFSLRSILAPAAALRIDSCTLQMETDTPFFTRKQLIQETGSIPAEIPSLFLIIIPSLPITARDLARQGTCMKPSLELAHRWSLHRQHAALPFMDFLW